MTIRLLRMPDVEHMTGLKRAAIYQRVANGTFPQPRRISERHLGWLESDIAAWIEALPVAGEKK